MRIVPFKTPSKWQMQIEIDGIIYIFKFVWNAINEYWSMSIYDGSETPLILGVKVVNNYDLLRQIVSAGLPSGNLICQSVIGEWGKIQRYDMGQKTELFYYEANEIASLT
jgi:hypothetical protein